MNYESRPLIGVIAKSASTERGHTISEMCLIHTYT